MLVAIHQPNFAPWLGYFHKMRVADVFVFLDDVQFSKNSYTNRVKIRGGRWLTVPVKAKLGTAIDQCAVADPAFADRQEGQLRGVYGKSAVVRDFMADVKAADPTSLVSVNYASIGFLKHRLGIETPTVLSSELAVPGSSTERLVNIVRAVGGSGYLSGAGGAGYQEADAFADAGIALQYSDFEHPVYGQGTGAFEPGLSALDYLVCQE